MASVWVALAGFAGVLATAVASWLIARRGTSGSVRTTEAATLWASAEQIRLELRDEVERRTEDNARLRERVSVLEVEQAKYQGCKERVAALEAEMRRLKEQNQ